MVKKMHKNGAAARASVRSDDTPSGGASPLAGAIKDSAQQIWLAGLGAFAKAQEEGSKAFETLVKEGLSIQRKTQAAAEERLNEATSRVGGMASEIQNKAAGQWDKLESLFEQRVAKALGRLGVPSASDVEALMERIDALNEQVMRFSGLDQGSTAKAPRKAAARSGTRSAASSATKAPARSAAKASAKTGAKPAAKASAPAKRRAS
jgi:poly(hydroxyalkanoate) granule-associated protein